MQFFLHYPRYNWYVVTRGWKIAMAAIVYQTNKKTGVTYAYESKSYWDKDKQQSRAKRMCIGRLDPETKEIVPTQKRSSRSLMIEKGKPGPVSVTVATRNFYGATNLFDQIGEVTGVAKDFYPPESNNRQQRVSAGIDQGSKPVSPWQHL